MCIRDSFHDRVVDGIGKGLHHKHVVLPDTFANTYERMIVRKLEHLGPPEWQANVFADLLDKRGVGVAAENRDLVVASAHSGLLLGLSRCGPFGDPVKWRPVGVTRQPRPAVPEPPAPPPAAPHACSCPGLRRAALRGPSPPR